MVYLLIENGLVRFVTQNPHHAELWIEGRKRIGIDRQIKAVPIYSVIKHGIN